MSPRWRAVDALAIGRAIFGALLIGVLPGWAWASALRLGRPGLERFVVAVGLSIALVVLVLYLASAAFGLAVNAAHAVWWAIALTLAAWAVGAWRARHRAAPTP